MNNWKTTACEMRDYLILWATQALSALGSAMTNFALILWSYRETGSALSTAMLSICSYAPYVALSVFAGALSDRWDKRRTMLVCDSVAAAGTAAVMALYFTGTLRVGHLYALNVLSGLMNAVQQPAADVASTLLIPPKHYQKASALRSASGSATSILTPVCAAALMGLAGLELVFAVDLATFFAAFAALMFAVKIPRNTKPAEKKERLLDSARGGIDYLKKERGVLHLILFLAAINLTASAYSAALPAMILSRAGGGEGAYGVLNAVTGAATLAGSLIAALLPQPKSRVRVICNTLLISMSTENFFLAFGRSLPVWCAGAVLGWLVIPTMNANLDVVMRGRIPVELQGRVFSVRNTAQFFTIPIGYALGGALVDGVFEPLMARASAQSLPALLFGTGKGSGAAALFCLLAVAGVATCLIFRRDREIWKLEE